jgi:hypothetical protein
VREARVAVVEGRYAAFKRARLDDYGRDDRDAREET